MTNNIRQKQLLLFIIFLLLIAMPSTFGDVHPDRQTDPAIGSNLSINSPDALSNNRQLELDVPDRIMELGERMDWSEDLTSNPSDLLVLVNKTSWLPADYEPPNLTKPNIPFSFSGNRPSQLVRDEVAQALEELFAKAAQENISLVGVSGYRSYQDQERIFSYYATMRGEEAANRSSARPGQSEHQTGLAMDVSTPSINNQLIQAFGDMPEGIWLARNAPEFGFIIRYPKDKTHITGYIYEPWHLRYVGVEAAMEITEKEITLEEYIYQLGLVAEL